MSSPHSSQDALHPFFKYGLWLFVVLAGAQFLVSELMLEHGYGADDMARIGLLTNLLVRLSWFALGVALVGVWQSADTFRLPSAEIDKPADIKAAEWADYEKWIAADASRKYLTAKERVAGFRRMGEST